VTTGGEKLKFWFVFGKRESLKNQPVIRKGRMSLPINPSEITVPRSANIKTADVVGLNEEITIPGGLKSQVVVIDSLLWGDKIKNTPSLYIALFEQLMQDGQPFRFFVDSQLRIAGNYVIDDLTWTVKAGEEKDIYYKLTLRRHPSYKARRIKVRETQEKQSSGTKKTKVAKTPPPRSPYHAGLNWQTYTVVKGDWLIKITQRYVNAGAKGSTYRELFDANRKIISNPNLIFPGQKLTIPPVWRERAGVKI
jgi:LysM repeat protein